MCRKKEAILPFVYGTIYGTSAHHTMWENVRMQKDKCLWPLTFICNLQSSTHRKKAEQWFPGLGAQSIQISTYEINKF